MTQSCKWLEVLANFEDGNFIWRRVCNEPGLIFLKVGATIDPHGSEYSLQHLPLLQAPPIDHPRSNVLL